MSSGRNRAHRGAGLSRRGLTSVCCALVAVPGVCGGQATTSRPAESWATPFVAVSWVVELRPGLLLVGDASGMELTRMDLETGRTQAVSRHGSGPREFRALDEHPLPRPGGGAFVVDFAQARLLPIASDGAPGEVVPYPQGVMLRTADADGALYGELMVFSNRRLSDSARIVRWRPGSSRVDTLVTIDAGRSSMVAAGGPMRIWSPSASWTVSTDGTIWVLESLPYRLRRWKDGRWSAPVSLPWTERAPTRDEVAARRREVEAQPVRGIGTGRPAAAPRRTLAFPELLPAFEPMAPLIAAPDGTLWIERLTPGRAEVRYDVIDADGLRGSRVLPPQSKVVGVGPTGVYVSETGADDFVRVRRYALPGPRT